MKNLMVIDMQKGFNPSSEFVNRIDSLLSSQAFEKVFYTRFFNHEESSHAKFLNWNKMMSDEETEICVSVVEDAIIFPKDGYGLQPQQIAWMKKNGIGEVLLCGMDIDCCVLAIAFNLFDNGIRPYFKWDCCETKNKDLKAKERVKSLIQRNFGKDSIIE